MPLSATQRMVEYGVAAAIPAPKGPKMLDVYEGKTVFRGYDAMLPTKTNIEPKG